MIVYRKVCRISASELKLMGAYVQSNKNGIVISVI